MLRLVQALGYPDLPVSRVQAVLSRLHLLYLGVMMPALWVRIIAKIDGWVLRRRHRKEVEMILKRLKEGRPDV